MLARAMPTILPEMSVAEALEVTRIYSVRGLLPSDVPLIRERPFRSPHHGTSSAGLIGGGSWPRPGEVSLAHRGVLFLDELPEFSASTLEMLRQPLEDRTVSVARASGTVSFPANFTLIAATRAWTGLPRGGHFETDCGWLAALPCLGAFGEGAAGEEPHQGELQCVIDDRGQSDAVDANQFLEEIVGDHIDDKDDTGTDQHQVCFLK